MDDDRTLVKAFEVLERQQAVIRQLAARLDAHERGMGQLASASLEAGRELTTHDLLLQALALGAIDMHDDRLRFVDDLRRRSLDRIPPKDLAAVRDRLEAWLSALEAAPK